MQLLFLILSSVIAAFIFLMAFAVISQSNYFSVSLRIWNLLIHKLVHINTDQSSLLFLINKILLLSHAFNCITKYNCQSMYKLFQRLKFFYIGWAGIRKSKLRVAYKCETSKQQYEQVEGLMRFIQVVLEGRAMAVT